MININNYKFKTFPRFKIDDVVYLKSSYSKFIPNSTSIFNFDKKIPAMLTRINASTVTLIMSFTEIQHVTGATIFKNSITNICKIKIDPNLIVKYIPVSNKDILWVSTYNLYLPMAEHYFTLP